jgi:hypothetical protein
VLGALWSSQQTPPTSNLDGTNSKRVIKSRAGHTITFDDTGDAGSLVIQDKLGSSISLDATDGSITISAKGDLTISAGKTLTLEAAQGLTKITMNATKVDVT